MKNAARAAGIASVAVIAASFLTACSSTPSHPASSTTTSSSAAPTTTTTSSPPASTTTAATTTCQPSELHITLYGSSGAAGTIELTFSLTNNSASLCTMSGYPGMQLLNASGASQPTMVIRGGGLAFENVAVSNVSLAAGQTAYFNVGYNDVVTGTSSCTVATQVDITPPNDTAFATVPVSLQIDACGGGTLHVSPVFASSDAAATSTTAPAG